MLCTAYPSTAREREGQIRPGRHAQPEDVARAVALLASEEAASTAGLAINVSGGLSMH